MAHDPHGPPPDPRDAAQPAPQGAWTPAPGAQGVATPGQPAAPRPASPPGPNVLVRAILWITAPSLIKGVALGLALALVGTMTLKLEAVWYLASGLMMIVVALIIGAILGHYVYEYNRRKVAREAGAAALQAGEAARSVWEGVLTALITRDTRYLAAVREDLTALGPLARSSGTFALALVFRMMAMGTLIAVLGGVVSFAVFLTSYMQVERMGEQNQLLQNQTKLLEEQNKLISDQQTLLQAEAASTQQEGEARIALAIAEQRENRLRDFIAALTTELDRAIHKPEVLARSGRINTKGRYVMSDGTEALLRITLDELRPYRGVDPETSTLRALPSSPEQAALFRFLIAEKVELDLEAPLPFDLRNLEVGAIDLTGAPANLAGADLRGISLARARLGGLRLRGARLDGAVLDRAELGRVDLQEAVLSDASLRRASLRDALLNHADLRGASLVHAELRGATLSDANLEEADLTLTRLAGAREYTVDQLKAANFWWLAAVDDELAGELGLPDGVRAVVAKAAAEIAGHEPEALDFQGVVTRLQGQYPSPPG
ncbi:MAG: pentapeptide repeat-containing protein [Nannocystaceae bacterium]